jgi:hypothetical protein
MTETEDLETERQPQTLPRPLPPGCLSDSELISQRNGCLVAISRSLSKILTRVVNLLSGEWLFGVLGRANGSGIIVARACFISLFSFFFLLPLMLWLWNGADAGEFIGPLDIERLHTFWHRHASWLAVLFGSSYTALYARFSAQWRYLADVYNKIKEAEIKYGESGAKGIAEWKAGFIEDAVTLHLASKPVFAQVIKVWLDNHLVRDAFVNYSGGSNQYNAVRHTVLRVLAR